MIKKKGTLFIISAPSGAGKTSLVKALVNDIDNIQTSISYTTRKPRRNEKEGESYHFVDEDEFKRLIKQNQFLEYAKIFNHYYGTSRKWVEEKLTAGHHIILEIDWQGRRQINSQLHNCVSIFILPPNCHSLRQRLTNRKSDEPEIINSRMQAAKEEIVHYREYHFIIINDQFEQALIELKAIITATNLDKNRQKTFYDNFVDNIMAQAH